MQLEALSTHDTLTFIKPLKRINEGQDVPLFLVSQAYRDITTFLVQLNHSMFPQKDESHTDANPAPSILQLQALLKEINTTIDQVPLDPGTHRFGNTAFRKWFQLLEEQSLQLLSKHLPKPVLEFPHDDGHDPVDELHDYLMGAFGSAQRLDYGTGHELSFLAFLAGVWKLGGFQDSNRGQIEKDIVLKLIGPYLALIRKLILKYSLEPAGTHGVWGLDDHSFLPYIFGSAQYGPPTSPLDATPTEGSSSGTPNPGDVVRAAVVERERKTNLYFGAIGFIYDVKKGPFWEHSPTLFDISGVKDGWAKINKGMLKMYNAEVLSKFPVVQHFPFGGLFSFDRDPQATIPASSAHTASQPRRETPLASAQTSHPTTAAPWSTSTTAKPKLPATTAPWNSRAIFSSGNSQSQARHPETMGNDDQRTTRAPWAK